jgi:hypothetical protein
MPEALGSILVTQEAEIRRIMIRGQQGEIEILS